MLARRPRFLWTVVALVGLLAAAMPLVFRSLHPPIAGPKTLMELAEMITLRVPSLFVVPEVENRPELGIYICTQPRSRKWLLSLARNPTVIGRSSHGSWQGVVFCERTENYFLIEHDEFLSWGEYGMRIGPLLFLGDPALLHRIHELIFSIPPMDNTMIGPACLQPWAMP